MKFAILLLLAGVTLLQSQARTSLPAVIERTEPQYTAEALEAKLEGAVILSAIIGPEGTASQIRVVRGLGKGLDEKAIECLEQWRFRPGMRDGQPIPVRATVEIKFRLPPRKL